MSEFSDGYFLRSSDTEDVVRLLKKANVKGYVYPARDGWVAFAADTGSLFKFSQELKAANTGILLEFINAEDHGWGFQICVREDFVCSYHCGYNEEMDTEEPFQMSRKIETDAFEKLLKEETKFEVLRKYFDENAKAEDIVNPNDFTEEMELYFSEWISYHYAELEKGVFQKYGEYENLKLQWVD